MFKDFFRKKFKMQSQIYIFHEFGLISVINKYEHNKQRLYQNGIVESTMLSHCQRQKYEHFLIVDADEFFLFPVQNYKNLVIFKITFAVQTKQCSLVNEHLGLVTGAYLDSVFFFFFWWRGRFKPPPQLIVKTMLLLVRFMNET